MQKSERWAYIAISALAILLRCVDVWRPVDGTVRDLWREVDVASIARNFYLEGMNITLPRIDWRGDGPGYTEAEFPLHPWIAACGYHVFGYREEILRVISSVLSLMTFGLFVALCRQRLSRTASLVATAFFAVNPMAIRMATAIQPEPLMFFAYLLAVYAFLNWCELKTQTPSATEECHLHQKRRWEVFFFVVGICATSLAILAKIPAAHIGFLFACLCFHYFGMRCLLRRDVWVFAVCSVIGPVCWYLYARTLWIDYGNSLGMSNEAYLRISSGSFWKTLSTTLPNNAMTEMEWIWMKGGAILGIAGCFLAFKDHKNAWIRYWIISLLIYYIVSGRTTSEIWAIHYHVVSIPVAAICIGYSVNLFFRPSWSLLTDHWKSISAWSRGWTMAIGSLVLLAAFLEAARVTKWNLGADTYVALFEESRDFAKLMDSECLIVATGGGEIDQFGVKRAINAPYYFFWTKHKGFSLNDKDRTVAKLEEYKRRGARYFIGERRNFKEHPEFEADLRRTYRVLGEGKAGVLFDLMDDSGIEADPRPQA